MKRYIFPLFITVLGMLTIYTFYTVWHMEEVSFVPSPIITKEKKKAVESLANKVVIPKRGLAVGKEGKQDTQMHKINTMNPQMQKHISSPNLTPKQIEAQNQEIYDSLIPENYEETMENAEVTFDKLDAHVIKMNEKISEEMKAMRKSRDVEEEQEFIEENEEISDVEQDSVE